MLLPPLAFSSLRVQVLGVCGGAHVRVRQPHFTIGPSDVLRVLHSRGGPFWGRAHFLPNRRRAPRHQQRRSAMIGIELEEKSQCEVVPNVRLL